VVSSNTLVGCDCADYVFHVDPCTTVCVDYQDEIVDAGGSGIVNRGHYEVLGAGVDILVQGGNVNA